eukprot:Colp12_sorted_trinity150504_noHs@22646
MPHHREFLAHADGESRQDDLLQHDAVRLHVRERSGGDERPAFAAASAGTGLAAVCVRVRALVDQQGAVGHEHGAVAAGHAEAVVEQEPLELVLVAVQVGLAVHGLGKEGAEAHHKEQLVLGLDRLRVARVLLHAEVQHRQLVLVGIERIAHKEPVLLQALRHKHRHVLQLHADVLSCLDKVFSLSHAHAAGAGDVCQSDTSDRLTTHTISSGGSGGGSAAFQVHVLIVRLSIRGLVTALLIHAVLTDHGAANAARARGLVRTARLQGRVHLHLLHGLALRQQSALGAAKVLELEDAGVVEGQVLLGGVHLVGEGLVQLLALFERVCYAFAVELAHVLCVDT